MNQTINDFVLHTLRVYGANFGVPQSTDDVAAIAHTILNLHQQATNTSLATEMQAQLIQQVVQQFDPGQSIASVTDPAAIALANQVHQRQQALDGQVLTTLTAYVQNHLPNPSTFDPSDFNLSDTVLAILPLIADGSISRPEVDALIRRVGQRFNLQTALTQVIPSEVAAIAANVATILQHGHLDSLVQQTVIAYLAKTQPGLTRITDSLIQTALSHVLGSGLMTQLGLAEQLSHDQQNLLVQQVSFKLNIMQADPQPSTTAQDIAANMATEIDQFQRDRHQQLGDTNALQPTLLGDLEVGIPIYHADTGACKD